LYTYKVITIVRVVAGQENRPTKEKQRTADR